MDNTLKFAQRIALEAGNILLSKFGQSHQISTKESIHSVVTPVDLMVEESILTAINQNFPEHSILSEESGFLDKHSDYLWVIDPLDGSSYYSRGLETYAVSIALYLNKTPVIGVVYCPARNEMFYADRNEGAFMNGANITCSSTTLLKDAIGSFGHRYIRLEEYDKSSKAILQSVRSVRAGGSCAMELCYLASGRIDLVLTVNQSFWDYAAGMFIAEKSGCLFFDLNGNPWNFDSFWNSKLDLLSYSKSLLDFNEAIYLG